MNHIRRTFLTFLPIIGALLILDCFQDHMGQSTKLREFTQDNPSEVLPSEQTTSSETSSERIKPGGGPRLS